MLIFETHATSLDNEAALASGWHDIDLSPAGERQARELGERRRGQSIEAVYCSDLLRAHRTATLAFGDTDVPIVIDVRLRECDYGTLTRAAAAAVEAERVRRIDVPFPGGESYADVVRRTDEWRRDVRGSHGDADVLVIGHRATFYAFEHLFAGRPLAEVIAAPWRWQPGWSYDW